MSIFQDGEVAQGPFLVLNMPPNAAMDVISHMSLHRSSGAFQDWIDCGRTAFLPPQAPPGRCVAFFRAQTGPLNVSLHNYRLFITLGGPGAPATPVVIFESRNILRDSFNNIHVYQYHDLVIVFADFLDAKHVLHDKHPATPAALAATLDWICRLFEPAMAGADDLLHCKASWSFPNASNRHPPAIWRSALPSATFGVACWRIEMEAICHPSSLPSHI
eukprot:TRINITY_DN15454_c0_g1_i1.p1 TRINITY_DN15454_c0_g1~~TRINITY_DN15454_c0_g1_i1.p1  ORF type:complete len:218 (-),score=13.94 TRINITY_DN15454_c0_g1_i1:172-825(-)